MGEVAAFPFSEPEGLLVDPRYALMRREEPLVWVKFPHGGAGWLVTTYREARFVYSDPRFSKSLTADRDVPRMQDTIPPAGSLFTMDGAGHARLRRLLARALLGRMGKLRPRVQQITDDLLDRLDRPADLVIGYTTALPSAVNCELLGVPAEDHAAFQRWIDAYTTVDGLTPEEAADGRARLHDYLTDLVARRRARPADDLLGALVAARDEDGDVLSERELVMLGLFLLIGGSDTAATAFGLSIVTLLENPHLTTRLRDEPELLPGAVEELLRFTPRFTGAGLTRIATEDVEIGNVTVKEGDAVLITGDSANRDEAVFDRPEELDPRRDPNRHLAFGHGAHYCPGAQLARIELQAGLGTLIRRFPGLRLAAPVRFKMGGILRMPQSIVVTW